MHSYSSFTSSNFLCSEKSEQEPDPREKMLTEHPDLLISFGKNLFVVLVDMFTSTVNPSVRYKCLSAITKILYFETAEMLKDLLEVCLFLLICQSLFSYPIIRVLHFRVLLQACLRHEIMPLWLWPSRWQRL